MRGLLRTTCACLLLTGLQLECLAQKWERSTSKALLDQIAASSKKFDGLDSYRMDVQLASFRSFDDTKPFETGQSTIRKLGNSYRVDALGITTVQDENFRVTVDSAENVIVVARASNITDVLTPDLSRIVIESATVSMRQGPDGITYRADFRPGSFYSRAENSYDKEGWLVRMEVQWGHELKEDPDDPKGKGYRPKLVVHYARPKTVAASSLQNELDLSKYVVFHKGQPEAVGSWVDYQILDTRLQ